MKDTIIDAIRNRKSIYPIQFEKGAKIDDALIEEILEHAVWAPTHKLTQPWRFIVFRNDGVRRFFEKQIEIVRQISSDGTVPDVKIRKYTDKIEQVSHIIALIAEHDSGNSVPELEEVVAASCVLQNIYLLLNEYGIGGYLSTGAICYTPQMFEFLQLKPGERVLGFFQLGIPKMELKDHPRRRIAAKEKTRWEE